MLSPCQDEMNPVDWFSLAVLFQFKTIHQNIQTNHHSILNHSILNNHSILQALLILATQLIFNRHNLNLDSIPEIYKTIHSNLKQIPQLALNQLIGAINQSLQFAFSGSVDGLYLFIIQSHTLIAPSPSAQLDRPTDFHPDSPIGLYIRSRQVFIYSLEFDKLASIAARLRSFFDPQSTPPPLLPTLDPILDAYLGFTDSYAPDYNKSSDSLRRFYDIIKSTHNHSKSSNHFGSNHQQALLSLSKFYLSIDAYPTALDALEEAARSARLANDRSVLDQCASLRRRIIYFSGFESASTDAKDGIMDGQKVMEEFGMTGPVQAQARLQSLRNLGHSDDDRPPRDIKSRPDAPALAANEWAFWDANEEIFKVFKSILSGAEPINHLHARLFRANRMKLMGHHPETEESGAERGGPNYRSTFDQVSWFALQAKLWELQGQVGLCEIYEDLALDVLDDCEQDDEGLVEDRLKLISKSDVMCHRAIRLAKSGKFYEALVLVCQQIVENRCDAKSFRFIHQTVFEIFGIKARHDGNANLISSLKLFRSHPPPHPGLSAHKQIENLFDKAEAFIDQGLHHAGLCPIVSAITQAEKMNLKVEQARGIVLWANTILHLHPASTDQDGHQANTIFRKLAPVYDIPALHSHPLLQIELTWILLRSLIARLFPATISLTLDPARVTEALEEIFDACSVVDILYQKTENPAGRQKLIGYQLVVIEEARRRWGVRGLAGREEDLEARWAELLSDSSIVEPTAGLLERVQTLLTHCSVDRYV